jgi:hypothetical protein
LRSIFFHQNLLSFSSILILSAFFFKDNLFTTINENETGLLIDENKSFDFFNDQTQTPYFYSPSSTLIRQQKQMQQQQQQQQFLLKNAHTPSPNDKSFSNVKIRSKSSNVNASNSQQNQALSIGESQDFNNIGIETNDGARSNNLDNKKNNILTVDQFYTNQHQRQTLDSATINNSNYNQHQFRVKTQQRHSHHPSMHQRSQTVAISSTTTTTQPYEDMSTGNDLDEFSSRNNSYSKKSDCTSEQPKVISSTSNASPSGNKQQTSANTPQQTRNTSIKKLKNFFGEKVGK